MRIAKILLCISLIASLCLPYFPVSAAQESHPYVVLNEAAPSGTLLDVWAGKTKVTPALSTVAGKTGWITDKANDESAKNIYVDVDDSYLFNCVQGSEHYGAAVEIEVEYFDGDGGLFNVVYNSVHGGDYGRTSHISEVETPVELKGTNTWKTHTFRLYDIMFANQYENADFVVRTYDSGMRSDFSSDAEYQATVEYHNMYYKAADIVFGSISVRKIPIIATVESGEFGNIFFGAGEKDITVDFKNTTDEAITTPVKFELVSVQTGETLWSAQDSLTLSPKQDYKKAVTVPFEKYGTFMLNISTEATDTVPGTLRETECSLVVDNEGKVIDDRFGINTHIPEWSWGTGAYTEPLSNLLEKSGCGWVRESLRWGAIEYFKDKLAMPEPVMKLVDELNKRDIKMLGILGGTNSNYEGGKSLPFDDEALAAFEEYCYYVAKELKGKVDTFETWNEFNYKAYGIDAYMDILRATYNGVKRGNPDAKIVGGCVSFAKSWTYPTYHSLGQNGALEYMTALSNHPYSVDPPDVTDIGYDMKAVRDILDEYDKDVELWISELGWSNTVNQWTTGDKVETFSEEDSAAHQIQVYCHTIGRGTTEKFMVYDLMNDCYHQGGKESNLGLIESRFEEENVPFAAKPGYVGAVFLTKMLHDTEPQSYTYTDNTYRYIFNRNDGAVVDVVWNTSGSGSVDLALPESGTTVIYDMYGNALKTIDNSTTDTYTQALTKNPVYVEYKTTDIENVAERVLVADDFSGSAINTDVWNNVQGTASQVSLSDGAVKIYDIYENAGLGVKLDEAITEGKIKVKYDIYTPSEYINQNSSKDGSGNPQNAEIILYGGSGFGDANAMVWLKPNTGFTVSGINGAICKPTADTWYSVDLTIDVETLATTLKVTPKGGATETLSGICSKTNLKSIEKLTFGAKYLNMGTKSYVLVDNVSISIPSEAPVITFEADTENKEVTVFARMSEEDRGKNASLFVMKENRTFDLLENNPLASVVYVNQGCVDDNSLYSVNFKIPESAGFYTAYLGFDGYDERYELDIVVGKEFVVLSSINQDGKPVTALSQFDTEKDMTVIVRGLNESGSPLDIKLVYAFYNKGVLTGIDSRVIQTSDKDITKDVVIEGPFNNGKEFDSLSVFLWDNTDGITCLCKNISLE